jgi:hypothetical protein
LRTRSSPLPHVLPNTTCIPPRLRANKVSTQALIHAKMDSHGRTLDRRIASVKSVAVLPLLVPLCLSLPLPELPELPERLTALCNGPDRGH